MINLWHLIEASEDWKTSLQALRLELVWGNIHLWMTIIWLPILKLETTIYIYIYIDISRFRLAAVGAPQSRCCVSVTLAGHCWESRGLVSHSDSLALHYETCSADLGQISITAFSTAQVLRLGVRAWAPGGCTTCSTSSSWILFFLGYGVTDPKEAIQAAEGKGTAFVALSQSRFWHCLQRNWSKHIGFCSGIIQKTRPFLPVFKEQWRQQPSKSPGDASTAFDWTNRRHYVVARATLCGNIATTATMSTTKVHSARWHGTIQDGRKKKTNHGIMRPDSPNRQEEKQGSHPDDPKRTRRTPQCQISTHHGMPKDSTTHPWLRRPTVLRHLGRPNISCRALFPSWRRKRRHWVRKKWSKSLQRPPPRQWRPRIWIRLQGS